MWVWVCVVFSTYSLVNCCTGTGRKRREKREQKQSVVVVVVVVVGVEVKMMYTWLPSFTISSMFFMIMILALYHGSR